MLRTGFVQPNGSSSVGSGLSFGREAAEHAKRLLNHHNESNGRTPVERAREPPTTDHRVQPWSARMYCARSNAPGSRLVLTLTAPSQRMGGSRLASTLGEA